MRLPLAPASAFIVQIKQALGTRVEPLLILYNFEHLLPEGAALVQELLSHVPQLQLLITSRRELGIAGEHPFSVPPLQIPATGLSPEALLRVESAQLFQDRARHNRIFASTNTTPFALQNCASDWKVCRSPLNCAPRAAEMSPSKMLSRLQGRLDFLSESPPASVYRHPTLRAALEWSYALLWPQLQQFSARLSVFRGGFSSHAASVVTNQPHGAHFLEQLRAGSLVVRDDTGIEARFRFLETVREFAREQLAPEDDVDFHRRHARFFWGLTSDEQDHMMAAADSGRRIESMARVQSEHENLRAALMWSLQHEPGLALELVHLMSPFEGEASSHAHQMAELVLEQVPGAAPQLVSAVLGIAATHAQHRGDCVDSRQAGRLRQPPRRFGQRHGLF